MPQFLPFRGLRYTPAAGETSDLLAPPYDVISAAQQQALGQQSPYNAVHLELAEGGDERYERVAQMLDGWKASGVLARDEEPMFYVYEQAFSIAGTPYQRRAMIAAVEAQPWEDGAVKPHEFTMSGPKADRLKLLQATRTQFSPVFMIARDRAGQLASFIADTMTERGPDVEATSTDGVAHRLWAVPGGRFEMRRLAPLLSESFYIADGHHRYETAVAYRDWRAAQQAVARDHPSRFTMAAIVPASDAGLVIRGIHRVIAKQAPANWRELLEPTFDIETVKLIGNQPDQARELLALIPDDPAGIIALGLDGPLAHVFRLRDREAFMARVPGGHSQDWAMIAPNVLRYGVLAPLWGIGDAELTAGVVEYANDVETAVQRCETEPGTAAFLLNPVAVGDVLGLADRGERLPQKSTFFDPKLGTGLVFNPLEE